MRLRFWAFAVVLVAVTAAGAMWAHAAAVQPAVHQYVSGELFRYATVQTMGFDKNKDTIAGDGPLTMRYVEEVRVVDVSRSRATLAYRLDFDRMDPDKISDIAVTFRASDNVRRASRDGTWRFSNGKIAENFVTWDPGQLGTQPVALAAGQHWTVNIPGTASSTPAHGVVRVVSVDPNKLALHGESTPPLSRGVAPRGANGWYIDVVFEHGIVRELHSLSVTHTGAGDARFERRVRLLTHITP